MIMRHSVASATAAMSARSSASGPCDLDQQWRVRAGSSAREHLAQQHFEHGASLQIAQPRRIRDDTLTTSNRQGPARRTPLRIGAASALSRFLPILTADDAACMRRIANRATTRSSRTVNPMRLISARSASRRNTRGLGLPAGVAASQSISTKRNRAAAARPVRASLSEAGAMPIGFGKCAPTAGAIQG